MRLRGGIGRPGHLRGSPLRLLRLLLACLRRAEVARNSLQYLKHVITQGKGGHVRGGGEQGARERFPLRRNRLLILENEFAKTHISP